MNQNKKNNEFLYILKYTKLTDVVKKLVAEDLESLKNLELDDLSKKKPNKT